MQQKIIVYDNLRIHAIEKKGGKIMETESEHIATHYLRDTHNSSSLDGFGIWVSDP